MTFPPPQVVLYRQPSEAQDLSKWGIKMNDNLTTDNYQYILNKLHRDVAMREVEGEQRAHEACTAPSADLSKASAIHTHSRHLTVTLLVVLFILLTCLFPAVTHAQDLIDVGQGEFFTDAMVAYRVGYYYFLKGDYDRAIQEYEQTVQGIPQGVFAASVDYATIYWDLGDAQLMAEQYDQALASYQHYLDLAGDDATALAVAYVQRLAEAMNNGTVATVGLISG
ncbi:MAG: tetratricopeptide repeat protein [Chloroflexota bacterium]